MSTQILAITHKQPNAGFLRGVARSFAVYYRPGSAARRQAAAQTDKSALYQDWKQTGDDLKAAAKTYDRQAKDGQAK